jgi:hypothetical protein
MRHLGFPDPWRVFGGQLRNIYHWVFRRRFGELITINILILLKTITSLLWAVMCGNTSANYPINEEPLRCVLALSGKIPSPGIPPKYAAACQIWSTVINGLMVRNSVRSRAYSNLVSQYPLGALSSREGFAAILECLGCRYSEALPRILVSYTINFNFGLFGIGESTSSLDRCAELIMYGNTREFVFRGCKWLDVLSDQISELIELSMRKHGVKSRSAP